jgi:hypothetical protein
MHIMCIHVRFVIDIDYWYDSVYTVSRLSTSSLFFVFKIRYPNRAELDLQQILLMHPLSQEFTIPSFRNVCLPLNKVETECVVRCLYFLANKYGVRLESSWTHLITSSRNFVEVRWRSHFRSTSLAKRRVSYNAPPTSRKCAADRWSLRNFLPRSSVFMIRKAQKLEWGEIWIEFYFRLR